MSWHGRILFPINEVIGVSALQRSLAPGGLNVFTHNLPVWLEISNDLKLTISGFFIEKFDVLKRNIFSFVDTWQWSPPFAQRFYFTVTLAMNVGQVVPVTNGLGIIRGAACGKQHGEGCNGCQWFD